MSFVKKGSGAAKALSTVVKRQIGHAPPVAAHTALLPPGNEPLGGRYRVWNHNLPPTKGVAVSLYFFGAAAGVEHAIDGGMRLRMADGAGGCAVLSTARLRGCASLPHLRSPPLLRVSLCYVPFYLPLSFPS
jgi:hypothetical protein